MHKWGDETTVVSDVSSFFHFHKSGQKKKINQLNVKLISHQLKGQENAVETVVIKQECGETAVMSHHSGAQVKCSCFTTLNGYSPTVLKMFDFLNNQL